MKQQTLAMAADQNFENYCKPTRSDAAYARQKTLMASKAPNARDFTN